MGSFLFTWDHPASEVYVTGTFDGWKKTEKLEKVGDRFEKLVQLDDASQKIDYKVRDSRFLPVPRALLFPCPLASSCVLSPGHLSICRHVNLPPRQSAATSDALSECASCAGPLAASDMRGIRRLL
jgi:hypothetical protein